MSVQKAGRKTFNKSKNILVVKLFDHHLLAHMACKNSTAPSYMLLYYLKYYLKYYMFIALGGQIEVIKILFVSS